MHRPFHHTCARLARTPRGYMPHGRCSARSRRLAWRYCPTAGVGSTLGGGPGPIPAVRISRLTAWAALGVAALYLLSVPIGSLTSLPATDASGARVAVFFADHRT